MNLDQFSLVSANACWAGTAQEGKMQRCPSLSAVQQIESILCSLLYEELKSCHPFKVKSLIRLSFVMLLLV
jgi:hypothetical protein